MTIELILLIVAIYCSLYAIWLAWETKQALPVVHVHFPIPHDDELQKARLKVFEREARKNRERSERAKKQTRGKHGHFAGGAK